MDLLFHCRGFRVISTGASHQEWLLRPARPVWERVSIVVLCQSRKGLLSGKENDLKAFNLKLMLVELCLKFVVFLFLENLCQFVYLTIFPQDSIFELFDSVLKINRTLECTALTTLDCHRIEFSRNGFSAFTDRELVMSVKAAVLDFPEAEVLGVCGGVAWAVHIAMMVFVVSG